MLPFRSPTKVSLMLVAATALWLPARSVSADSEGRAGRVVRLTINAVGSAKYASYHGAITLRRSGAAKSMIYYWGGSTCPAQKFTDHQVSLLATAFHNRHRTLVAPRFADGEGTSTRCLVAFELVAAAGG